MGLSYGLNKDAGCKSFLIDFFAYGINFNVLNRSVSSCDLNNQESMCFSSHIPTGSQLPNN